MTAEAGNLRALERKIAEAVGASDVVLVSLAGGLALFLAAPDIDNTDRENLKQHLWGQIFDSAYGKGLPSADPVFNSTTFDNSYTKSPFQDDDLRPVMEGITTDVLSFRPRRVLEIGCGMGMLLFQIAPHCERYVGLDLSPSALAYVERHLGDLGGRVELLQRSAADLEALEAGSFDLVLVNSTVQYFPGVDYLLKVLRGAERALAKGGRIFLGDLRCWSLAGLFYASLAVHQADDSATAESIRAAVGKAAAAERELLLDPCILHTLARHLPRLAGAFHAIHRSGRVHELTQFRYNALLAFDHAEKAPLVSWHDWPETGDSIERVRRWVADSDAPCIGVRGVPNSRVEEAVLVRNWLTSVEPGAALGDARRRWRSAARSGIDVETLVTMGEGFGKRVACAFSPGHGEGRLDVLFTRMQSTEASFVPASACIHAVAAGHRLPIDYASDPIKARRRDRLENAVRAVLPETMRQVPVYLLAAIPRTPAGSADVERLQEIASMVRASSTTQ